MGGLIGRATGEKDGLFSRINAERRFSIVNKTLKIIAEKFSPCELFVYRYNTGVTTTGILHINSYLKSANWYLEDIEAYIDNESNVYIKGVPEESSNFHIIISPTISTINVAYEIIDGIIDTSSFQRINKK